MWANVHIHLLSPHSSIILLELASWEKQKMHSCIAQDKLKIVTSMADENFQIIFCKLPINFNNFSQTKALFVV